MGYGDDVFDFVAMRAAVITESGRAHRAIKDFAQSDYKYQLMRTVLQAARATYYGAADYDDSTLDAMARAASDVWGNSIPGGQR